MVKGILWGGSHPNIYSCDPDVLMLCWSLSLLVQSEEKATNRKRQQEKVRWSWSLQRIVSGSLRIICDVRQVHMHGICGESTYISLNSDWLNELHIICPNSLYRMDIVNQNICFFQNHPQKKGEKKNTTHSPLTSRTPPKSLLQPGEVCEGFLVAENGERVAATFPANSPANWWLEGWIFPIKNGSILFGAFAVSFGEGSL